MSGWWKSSPFWCLSVAATCSLWYILFLCKGQFAASFYEAKFNERPVIAVVGQRLTKPGVLQKYPEFKGKSFIGAAYVKFIESAGARVVPVGVDTNMTAVEQIFANTNGALFTGGSGNILTSNYRKIVKRFMDMAKEAHEKSDRYPMLGICLGLEEEVTLTAGKNVCMTTSSHNIGLPMKFTEAAEKSFLFRDVPDNVRKTLSTTKAAFHSHDYSILVDVFNKMDVLRDFYNILTTSKDRDGVEFIASLEAKKYPIIGLHWHPEKTMFEWDERYDIDRSEEATYASQYIANRFVSIARENMHEFQENLQSKLIYHYPAIYTGDLSRYQQMYIL